MNQGTVGGVGRWFYRDSYGLHTEVLVKYIRTEYPILFQSYVPSATK